jgi:hypothetical protein
MTHRHPVYDTDTHFKIDGLTRIVKNASETKTMLVQYDHNSERFTFEVPRYVDGHDLSLCNAVRVHYINIDKSKRTENKGVYEITDLQISPNDEETVVCSWLVSNNATQLIGALHFVVQFACTSGSEVLYSWNTARHTSVSVADGIYNGDEIAEDYADILQLWEARLLEDKEYISDLSKNVSDLSRDVSDLSKNVSDLSDEIKDEGSCISDPTVSSVKPVPETSAPYAEVVEIGGMTRKCTNLIPFPYGNTTKTENGITFTVNADGGITINGTASGNASFYILTQQIFRSGITYSYGGQADGVIIYLSYTDESGATKYIANPSAVTWGQGWTLVALYITVTTGKTINNATVYPMLNEGSTALPYEPYFEGLRSAPTTEVESVGVNLWKPFTTQSLNGVALTVDENGVCTLNGTCAASANFTVDGGTLDAGTYWFSDNAQGTFSNDNYARVQVNFATGLSLQTVNNDASNKKVVMTLKEPTTYSRRIRIESGHTYSNCKLYPMLNKGTAQPYRPYFRNTLPIPEAVRNIDGYGEGNPDNAEEYNAIICKDGKWKYSHKGDIEDNAWTPLATPEVTDISDILPDNLIGVEDGGTVSMVNEFGYDVPNTVNFYTYNNELMCADTFVGDLKGTANKALCDGKGRDIAKTLDEMKTALGTYVIDIDELVGEGD